MANKTEDPNERLKRAYETVCSFPEGIEVLKHICAQTGFGGPLVVVNDSREVNIQATIHNTIRADFWVDIRKFLTKDNQQKIEAGGPYDGRHE